MSNDVWQKSKRPARGWIIAPNYSLAMEEWRYAQQILKDIIVETKKSNKSIILAYGHEIEFKSADNKDENLRGAGLDWAIMAEGARIPRDAWEQGIRPALSDKRGRSLWGSTPKGRNLFFDNYLLGQDKHNREWESWTLPSNSNPHFPPEEWEELRRTLPELVFKQEFMAEFLEDSSVVFRNIKRCISGDFEDPEPGHTYVMGVDLAKTYDFTVIFVLDITTKHFVFFDRFQDLDWALQKKKIYVTARKYNNAMVSIDSTGIGDPIEEDLIRQGLRVQGYKFNNISKKELVELGIIALEQQWVTYPEIPEFINEMLSFEYEILPTGKVRYQAPAGIHDDCVIAFCLALVPLKGAFYPKKAIEDIVPKGLDDRSHSFWERHQLQKRANKVNPEKDILEDL